MSDHLQVSSMALRGRLEGEKGEIQRIKGDLRGERENRSSDHLQVFSMAQRGRVKVGEK